MVSTHLFSVAMEWPHMRIPVKLKDDSFDYTTSCGHNYHRECFKPWFERNKCCPYCSKKLPKYLEIRKLIMKSTPKPLPRPCDVCKTGPSDFVTRCHHFIHKDTCSGLGNRRYGRCPVCSARISRSQEKELICTRYPWKDEDLETFCPLSLREIAILACENSRFFTKVSLKFIINRMREIDSFFHIDQQMYKRSELNLSGIACRSKNVEEIKELIRLGSKPNPERYFSYSPITFAFCYNDLGLFNLIIEYGSNPSEYHDYHIINSLYSLDETEPKVFERLIEVGANPIARKFPNNETLLIHAVQRKRYNSIKKLIDQYKVNVNAKTKDGLTALHYAFNSRIIDDLVKRGANIHAKTNSGFSTFQFSCFERRFDGAKRFYELLKPDVNAYDPDGNTPLIYAAMKGDIDFFEFLLSKGANLNRPSKHGNLPISYACTNHNFEIVQRCLDLGSSLNKLPPGAKRLPIHDVACHHDVYKNILAIEKLICLGADINARDYNGDTALHLMARRYFRKQLIEALVIRFGADVNAKNYKGKRPIDVAVNERVVLLLLEHGSMPKQKWYQIFTSCAS